MFFFLACIFRDSWNPRSYGAWVRVCKIERVHFKLGWALKIQWGSEYSNHLNTEHLNTRCIWKLNSMGDRYSNGKVKWLGGPFKYRTLGTINRLFSVWFSDHHSNTGPFDYQAQIYHFCTRLVRHSEGYFNGLDWYLNWWWSARFSNGFVI